ncbi:MAG: hypothetical protein KatS3mg103_0995 [Phycisphaerales bacterium]|nr:MAG: hypothetical protein KatS3mg103_0995 [Phycisphaerales bacterium]
MRFGLGDVPLGLLAVVIAFPVVAAVGEASRILFVYATRPGAAHGRPRHAGADPPAQPGPLDVGWSSGSAILGAAVIEELIFRAFVQTSILRMTGSAWLAVIVTAGVFAMVHRVGQAVPWHALAPLFVLGVAIGVAYERFKGLGVPIAMHAGFNAINIALVLWVVQPAEPAAGPAGAPRAEPLDGRPPASAPASPSATPPATEPPAGGWSPG